MSQVGKKKKAHQGGESMRNMFQSLLYVFLVFNIGCGDSYGDLGQRCYPDGTCESGYVCDELTNNCINESIPDDTGETGNTGDTGNTGECIIQCVQKCKGADDGCGGTCPANGCSGCCDINYECHPSSKTSCGINGDSCVPCDLNEVCSNGICEKDCTSHYEERCEDGDVYWFDSCGEIEEISKTCTSGKVCENAECVCVSKQEKKCYDGNVYWYDSCGQREELYQTCGAGTACTDGSCEQCTGTRQQKCYGNSIYWYDSCGELETKVEDCQNGKVCSNATCICQSNYTKKCYNGDVYWYDSCGVLGSIATNCSSTQVCSNGSCATDYSCSSWKDCAPFPDHVCKKSTSKCEKLSCETDYLRCREACEQDIISCNFTIEASNMNCSSKSKLCCYFSVSFEGPGNCSAP